MVGTHPTTTTPNQTLKALPDNQEADFWYAILFQLNLNNYEGGKWGHSPYDDGILSLYQNFGIPKDFRLGLSFGFGVRQTLVPFSFLTKGLRKVPFTYISYLPFYGLGFISI